MRAEQVLDNLTVKHMETLRKQIQSLVYYVLNTAFGMLVILSKF